jgi:hypothetical protein
MREAIKQYLSENNNLKAGILESITDQVYNYMVQFAIPDILSDNGIEDIGAIQHELAMGMQRTIRQEAPWIIGDLED